MLSGFIVALIETGSSSWKPNPPVVLLSNQTLLLWFASQKGKSRSQSPELSYPFKQNFWQLQTGCRTKTFPQNKIFPRIRQVFLLKSIRPGKKSEYLKNLNSDYYTGIGFWGSSEIFKLGGGGVFPIKQNQKLQIIKKAQLLQAFNVCYIKCFQITEPSKVLGWFLMTGFPFLSAFIKI